MNKATIDLETQIRTACSEVTGLEPEQVEVFQKDAYFWEVRLPAPSDEGAKVTGVSEDLVVAQIKGAEILVRWKSGCLYAILAKKGESGYVVSQHATAQETYNEWERLEEEYWIIPRTEAAYDEFVAKYPDAIAHYNNEV